MLDEARAALEDAGRPQHGLLILVRGELVAQRAAHLPQRPLLKAEVRNLLPEADVLRAAEAQLLGHVVLVEIARHILHEPMVRDACARGVHISTQASAHVLK